METTFLNGQGNLMYRKHRKKVEQKKLVLLRQRKMMTQSLLNQKHQGNLQPARDQKNKEQKVKKMS